MLDIAAQYERLAEQIDEIEQEFGPLGEDGGD
jgi:hypothetical protein